MRVPTIEKTAKPAMKLIQALMQQIRKLSPMIALSLLLKLAYEVMVPMQIPREKKI